MQSWLFLIMQRNLFVGWCGVFNTKCISNQTQSRPALLTTLRSNFKFIRRVWANKFYKTTENNFHNKNNPFQESMYNSMVYKAQAGDTIMRSNIMWYSTLHGNEWVRTYIQDVNSQQTPYTSPSCSVVHKRQQWAISSITAMWPTG